MGTRVWVVLLTDLFAVSGGIPTFNRELVSALEAISVQRNWTLRILVLNDAITQGSPSKAYDYRGFSGKSWRFVLASLWAAWGAEEVLFGHVHLTPLGLLMPGRNRWLVAHGIEVWSPLSWLRRLGLGRIEKILCVSRFTRDRLRDVQHVPAERITLFPNTAHFPKAQKKERIQLFPPGNFKIIFTLSRLWPQERYKKVDRVIEAMPSILKTVPDALYVIAGDGPDRSRLEQLAQDHGVGNRVVFKGTIADDSVQSYFEACDVFVLPSLGEGFGIVYLEAMACGKPCIGANAGAAPEVIEDGRTGLIVAPDDSAAISVALIRLLMDEPLRRSMGQAGLSRFNAEYSIEHFRKRLAGITEGSS